MNHYYTVARGRKILSEAGRNYKAYAVQCMLIQKVLHLSEEHKPFGLHILARPPDNRRRDLDNTISPPPARPSHTHCSAPLLHGALPVD